MMLANSGELSEKIQKLETELKAERLLRNDIELKEKKRVKTMFKAAPLRKKIFYDAKSAKLMETETGAIGVVFAIGHEQGHMRCYKGTYFLMSSILALAGILLFFKIGDRTPPAYIYGPMSVLFILMMPEIRSTEYMADKGGTHTLLRWLEKQMPQRDGREIDKMAMGAIRHILSSGREDFLHPPIKKRLIAVRRCIAKRRKKRKRPEIVRGSFVA